MLQVSTVVVATTVYLIVNVCVALACAAAIIHPPDAALFLFTIPAPAIASLISLGWLVSDSRREMKLAAALAIAVFAMAGIATGYCLFLATAAV